jgi:hypothetical protein
VTQSPSRLEFDIRVLNEEGDQRKRAAQLVRILGIGLMFGLSALFGFRDFPEIARGTILGLRPLTTLSIWILTCILTYEAAAGLLQDRPGARVVRIDEKGIEVEYPSGRTVGLGWEDPGLAFDLYDWPGNQAMGRSIIVQRIVSALSTEAYDHILDSAKKRNRVKVEEGTWWTFPPSLRPHVYRVRGFPGAPRTPLPSELEPRLT